MRSPEIAAAHEVFASSHRQAHRANWFGLAPPARLHCRPRISSTSKSQKSSAEGSILRRFPIPGRELVTGRGPAQKGGAFVRSNAARILMNGRLIDPSETYKPSNVTKLKISSRSCGFKKRRKKQQNRKCSIFFHSFEKSS